MIKMNEFLPDPLRPFILQIQNEEIRKSVMKSLKRVWNLFIKCPGSLSHHHKGDGGLLRHTIEVCEIGLNIIESLDLKVNRDYYIASALLHDIGKCWEYAKDPVTGEWYKAKTLGDHEVTFIVSLASNGNTPLPREILYAILGHMGGWSNTSVFPDSLLAAVLSSADLISSRLE